jgi:alkylation response protein AidB-like acyl-CoA dehydrogenase
VDLSLTEQQQDLARYVGTFLAKECPAERVRAAEPLGFDAELWRSFVDMGLNVMAVPADRGGGGASVLDLAVVMETTGKHIPPVPLVESVVANDLLGRLRTSGEAEATVERLLREAAAGSVMTLAVLPPEKGVARLVPAGAIADVVLALVGDELVALRARGSREPSPPNLGSAPLGDWDLRTSERTVLVEGVEARAAYERAATEWRVLLASMLVGVATTALDLAVAYVKQRQAFGVLIGWFQTVQHRLADVVTSIDGAQLLAFEAAWALDGCLGNAPALASMAALYAAETSFKTCAESLHFHGGYGYTLEYDIQLYFRRAKAWPLAMGDPHREYRRLASLLFEAAM